MKVTNKLNCEAALKQDTSVKTHNIESEVRMSFDPRQMKVLLQLMHLLLNQVYYII